MKEKLILIIFFSFMIIFAFVLKFKNNKKDKNISHVPVIQQSVVINNETFTDGHLNVVEAVDINETSKVIKSDEILDVTKDVMQKEVKQIENRSNKKSEEKVTARTRVRSEEDVFKRFSMKNRNEVEGGAKIEYLPPPPPLPFSSFQTFQQTELVNLQVLGIMKKDNKLKVITNLGIFEENQKITDDEIIEEIQLNRIKTNKRIIVF
ncbi:MAG: hypothetical protein QXM53_10405 [Thermofilaceae archaeon]